MCSFNSSGLMSTYHQCVLVPCHLDESKWNDTESKQYLLSRKTRGEIKIWCALMIKYNVLECMKRYGKDIVTYNFQIIARSSKHTNSWDVQLYQELVRRCFIFVLHKRWASLAIILIWEKWIRLTIALKLWFCRNSQWN